MRTHKLTSYAYPLQKECLDTDLLNKKYIHAHLYTYAHADQFRTKKEK